MTNAARFFVRTIGLPLLAVALLLSLSACETPHGSLAGGASGNSGGTGHVSMGFPF